MSTKEQIWTNRKKSEQIGTNRGTIRVKIITGSLAILENWTPQKLPLPLPSWNSDDVIYYQYCYRLGVRSHPLISIDSQLPSWKSFEFSRITVSVTVLKGFWIRKVIISNMTVFQTARNATRNKSEENGEIETNQGDPLSGDPKPGAPSWMNLGRFFLLFFCGCKQCVCVCVPWVVTHWFLGCL